MARSPSGAAEPVGAPVATEAPGVLVVAGPLVPGDGVFVRGVETGLVEQLASAAAATTVANHAAAGRRGAGRGFIEGLYARRLRLVFAVLGCRALDAFELEDLLRERADSGRLYHEFIRTHDLSVGVYVLPAGGTDPQGPHTEDEVYHVVSGRARLTVGDEERPVEPGSIVFVGADVEHRFHDIEEELVALVVFGPAEYTHRVDHQRGVPHGAAPG
jgi:mannose-6-phosphate isomerase-like protein (cupin superfamily)